MSEFNVRENLKGIEEYEVETVRADIIANANESNYPMPPKVREKIEEATKSFAFNRYPPMKAESLAAAIASGYGIDPDKVRIGNGSSELLLGACYAFGGAGKKIAVPYPSFSMYGVYAQMGDAEALRYPLDADGYLDPKKTVQFVKDNDPSLLIICNPNNPTGNYNPLETIEEILSQVDCPVVVDEAYMEFAKKSGVDPADLRPLDQLRLVAGSALALLNRYSNFLVYRTFSKAYGLAGLRCGYAIGSSRMTHILGRALLPYHVNAYTLMAAKICYEMREEFAENIADVISQRKLMAAELTEYGMKVWPSETNFLCFAPEGRLRAFLAAAYDKKYGRSNNYCEATKAGKFIFKNLLEQRILIRDFTEHPALLGHMRLTVGRPEENSVVLDKIRTICRESIAYVQE